MPAQPLKALNERHHRFIFYYLQDLNAARAARLAGFSEKSADRIAHDLLKDPLVQEELQRQRDELAQQVSVTPALVLREYMRVAFAQLSHVAQWDQDGLQVKPSAELGPDEIAAISEMSTVQIALGEDSCILKTTTKVKLHAKLKALDAIVRHLDLKLLPDERPDASGGKPRGVAGALSPEDLRQIKQQVYGIEDTD